MSTCLYWSKVPVEPKDNAIYNLKWALSEYLWESDGSCAQSSLKVGKELIPFLKGIKVGNGSGDMGRDADKLIAAIENYGEVLLSLY